MTITFIGILIGLWYVLAFAGSVRAEDAVIAGLEPLQWTSEPHARLSHTVTMAVETVDSLNGVEYNFVCMEGDAPDSGWQSEPSYQATELKPETTYTFTAKVRDTSTQKELRTPSRPVAVTTRKMDKPNTRQVEQFDSIVANEIELIPIMVTGDKDNRINIVVINRWTEPGNESSYNKPELRDEFIEDVRAIVRGFTPTCEDAIVPVANYREFFNIYALWWHSTPPWNPDAYDKGENTLHWLVYNQIRARLFLPWHIEDKGWVTHLAMFNGDGGGGGAGLKMEQRVGDAMIVGNALPDFIHEFFHTAFNIGDEYTSSGFWGAGKRGYPENASVASDFRRDRVKWRAWIDPTTPVPTPYSRTYVNTLGIFEGGESRLVNVYRGAARGCLMGAGSDFTATQLCPVCRQTAIKRMYQLVNPIEKTTPIRRELTLEEPGKIHFAVKRIKPEPDTQRVEWLLNGKVIATDVDEVDVTFDLLHEYELIYSLTDETEMIRPDPPYAEFPHAEVRWKIINPKPSSTVTLLDVSLACQNPSVRGINDGKIEVEVEGGKPPYTYVWANGDTTPSLMELDAGTYELSVIDSEFRRATAKCLLTRPCTLVPEIRSELKDGKWSINLNVTGDVPENITCKWSTGAEGNVINALQDGTYQYTITHKSGAEITSEVVFKTPKQPLQLASCEVIPSTGENNGQILLEVAGGREPYTFTWSDKTGENSATRHFLPPGDYTVVVKDANQTAIERTFTVKDEPAFSISNLVFEQVGNARIRIAHPDPDCRYLWYDEDYPYYVLKPPLGNYEGTFTTRDGRLFKADALVRASKAGVIIGEENEFRARVYLQAWTSGFDKKPLWFSFGIDMKDRYQKELHVDDKSGDAEGKGTIARGKLTLEVSGTNGGRFDLQYTGFHENMSRPVHVGTDFRPAKPGNYYVAVQRMSTGAISSNRVGVAITMAPTPEVKTTHDGRMAIVEPLPGFEYLWYDVPTGGTPVATGVKFTPTKRKTYYMSVQRAQPFPEVAVSPDQVKSGKLLLWLDASDIDGDGVEDKEPPPRGAIMRWKGKANSINWSDNFVFYQPNAQNGRPVASWETIWLQNLDQPVSDYQTVILAYKDHNLSREGTGPWAGVPLWLWNLTDKPELRKTVPEELKKAMVYLNGFRIDPCATPAPMDFCVATFEYESPLSNPIHRTDTGWEGSIAEILVYDGKLTEAERQGVEEYLRRKWISAAHLESPRQAINEVTK